MNCISIVGNVTKDIELAQTKNGTSVTDLTIAVNDGFGENKNTYFFRVIAFGAVAEACEKCLSKGSQVAVMGKLTQRKYKNKDGVETTVHEIIANTIDFVGNIKKADKKIVEVADEDYPF